jgi:hypothetical protein
MAVFHSPCAVFVACANSAYLRVVGRVGCVQRPRDTHSATTFAGTAHARAAGPSRPTRRTASTSFSCSAGVSHLDIRCGPATSPTGGGSSPRAARSGASTAGTASECRRGTARRCSAGRIVCSDEGWGSEAGGDRNRRSASPCDGMRCHACNEDIGRITVASFGAAITGGHTGRDPSFDLGLQPTHRVRGELTPGRKLPPHTPDARALSETVPCVRRRLGIEGGALVNAQAALNARLLPCHAR